MKNQYGYFSDQGRQFIITDRDIPRHWYNYMWNDTYISFISQVGFGESFAQDDMGRRIFLVAGRNIYLIDCEDGEFWTANGLPISKKYNNYNCVHGIGYSQINLQYNQIASSFRVFVPNSGNCEIWSLKLKNNRSSDCHIKAIAYIRTEFDGCYKPQGYNTSIGWYDEGMKAVIGKSFKAFNSEKDSEVYGFLTTNFEPAGFDSRKNAFIGTYGEESAPIAVVSGGCQNSYCNSEKLCFALEVRIHMKQGEEKQIHFLAGVSKSLEDISILRSKFFAVPSNNKCDCVEKEQIKRVEDFYTQIIGATIQTPDENLNNLFNYWIKHQANMGSRWARVRHNGFRDLVQDTECFACINPYLAWQRLKRVFRYQYPNGYAPRTFLDGQIRDNNFSDNTVWLTFATYSILMETGDISILDEQVPFNDGSIASVYEHIKRSINFLWNFRGLHGLIKIWGGDWNDTLDKAGLEGKGVSVWLSMAWYRACKQFEEIAKILGNYQDALEVSQCAEEMKEIVNKWGWDGEYYLTAYSDQNIKIGSSECEEGKIFLIPQLWAVLSGIAKDQKEIIAMNSVEKYLQRPLGTLISWPSYTKHYDYIGHMTQKPAGVNENGGVYLHPCAWKLAVDSILKRNENVQEGLEKILPFNNKWVEKKCEPYVMCNCYFTEETGYRYATAGQSWRTATGGWLVKALVEYVFGIQPTMNGIKLNPCLPPSWRTCSITKHFREAEYFITYEQIRQTGTIEIIEIKVNGKIYNSVLLPYSPRQKYNVSVILG